ncbi:MAG: hypothetical protein FJX76_24805 [Armatimonadetes bacterium]|nr:hypothetical protein [Armatimonadota bacterium]
MPSTGWHRGMGRAQEPSGSGPSSQGPPARGDRLHVQRSPLRTGLHSALAMHRPLPLGPTSHGRPSRAWPHTQGSFGRW